MRFRVDSNDQTVVLSLEQLVDLLAYKATKKENTKASKTSPQIAMVLTRFLQEQGLLNTLTPAELACISIDVGYLLNTFLRKNTVTIEEHDADSTSSDSGSPEPSGSDVR